ncbi:hypothetical protein [Caenimonas soli]|uniref:hypothetical protein n=1 Tax=Caenimonas soli TaxID=2735555 RepID=UPI0015547DEB|nr:hypothetical protein [Caenimonas soli]NPC56291.1 hypothetical protein [Caenimonas soli]
MSALTKIAGLVAGVSTVAVLGVAIAQSEPPNPMITNHPIAAGQQSTHVTPMGETGVLVHLGEVRTATIVKEPEVAVVQPEPAAPAPEPVAAAPAAEPPTTTIAMGAPAAPEPAPAPRVVRADRN